MVDINKLNEISEILTTSEIPESNHQKIGDIENVHNQFYREPIIKKKEINVWDFSNFEIALKCAEMLCKARCIPQQFWDNPADALVVIQFGSELGLSPMVSLQNIMIVNNRPSVYGEALLAICMSAIGFIDCIETYDESTQTAWCTMKRKGRADVTRKFSKSMAETAGLWGKRGQNGPSAWVTHPERMMLHRARGFAAKDMFPDKLKGISIAEEMEDITYFDQRRPSNNNIENTAESMKERLKNKSNTYLPSYDSTTKEPL